MKFASATCLLIASLLAGGIPAHAIPIIDTGPGAAEGTGPTLGDRAECNCEQRLAAKFNLDRPTIIRSIELWAVVLAPGRLDVSVSQDAGEIPGSNRYGMGLTLATSPEAGWVGATDLSWALDPGTWWVVFGGGPRGGLAFATAPGRSPFPVLDEAVWSTERGWLPDDTLDLGLRVTGDIAEFSPNPISVPAPNTFDLLLLALTTLAVTRLLTNAAIAPGFIRNLPPRLVR